MKNYTLTRDKFGWELICNKQKTYYTIHKERGAYSVNGPSGKWLPGNHELLVDAQKQAIEAHAAS